MHWHVPAERLQRIVVAAGVETREARLKSALKANIAKRKAQARARGEKSGTSDGAGHKKEG